MPGLIAPKPYSYPGSDGSDVIRHVPVCQLPSHVNSVGAGCRSSHPDEIELLPSSLRAESGRPLATCLTDTNRCATPVGQVYRPETYATCGLFGSIRTTPVCTAFAPPLWLLVGVANATEAVPITATTAAANDAARNRFLLTLLPLVGANEPSGSHSKHRKS